MLAALARSGGISVASNGTAQLAAGAVPDSLPGAIADRLGFVSAPTREVLRAAALLGVEFAITDLTAVLGRTVADLVPALDEARATGVLADFGSGLAFRHPLIREALYAEMPASVRAAWHRDAGHALASAGAAPDRVARQLLRALGGPGPDAREAMDAPDRPSDELDRPRTGTSPARPSVAVEIERPPVGPDSTWSSGPVDEWMMEWLATSADSLVGQAPAVAAELLAQAVGSIPAGSARHGWLAGRLADALYRTGDREAAVQVAERALGYAVDPDLVVDLHWTLAQCRMLAGSVEASFATLEQALAAPGLSAKHRARLLVLGARTYLYFGDLDAAGRESSRALDSAIGAGDSWATGWALHVLALAAAIAGRPDRRSAALRTRARRDRDRPGADRPRTAAAGQQGRHAVQPEPLRRGADHGGARPGSSRTRSARRSGWGRRTAFSASCSSRPDAGTTRWPRSTPCRPT